MNIIARLEYELAYYDSAVHRFNHYTTRTLLVLGMLQGDTLATYLFIICLNNVLRVSLDKMKENGFKLTKERSKRYLVQIITDANYADDIALLSYTPTQAEAQLYRLERAAADIGLHVNAHKTGYMCFNQRGDISSVNGSSLKLVDKFTYHGSSSSTVVHQPRQTSTRD